jgi:hypothetical protein
MENLYGMTPSPGFYVQKLKDLEGITGSSQRKRARHWGLGEEEYAASFP